MKEETNLGNCPDCGQPYRPHEVVLAEMVQAPLEVEEATEPEMTAAIHNELECPVAKERDLISGLRQAVQHFGEARARVLLRSVIEEFQAEGATDEQGRPRDLLRPLKGHHYGDQEGADARARTGGVRRFPMEGAGDE